jgi:hypothetical protein
MGEVAVTPEFNYTFAVDDATENEFWIGTELAYEF